MAICHRKEEKVMHNRSRQRRRRYHKKSRSNVNFTPVIIMLCLSVGCGYAAAKYVVDPVVNYVPQFVAEKSEELTELTSDNDTDVKDTAEDEPEVKEAGQITGYALQFGCYSGQSAAESAVTSIGIEGLKVLKQNDMYKIVGEVYKTKEEAKTALGSLPPTAKAFVTPIYE